MVRCFAWLDCVVLPKCILFSAERVIDRMRVLESLDPDFTRYPRLKKLDDMN